MRTRQRIGAGAAAGVGVLAPAVDAVAADPRGAEAEATGAAGTRGATAEATIGVSGTTGATLDVGTRAIFFGAAGSRVAHAANARHPARSAPFPGLANATARRYRE